MIAGTRIYTLAAGGPKLYLTVRVDTNAQPNLAAAVSLWQAYLSSRPDSVKENPLWKELDRNERFSFDPARIWIFQSQEMMNTYHPVLLSAEPDANGLFLLRTLFTAPSDSVMPAHPLAVYRVYAQKSDSGLFLRSALSVLTQNWETRKMSGLTFVFPPEHKYSSALARRAARFCDSLTALFDLPDVHDARMYIVRSRDELARILGFDYYLAPPYGLTYPERDIIISSFDSEWHPHELAHLVFRPFARTHKLLLEGIATWCGGSLGESYEMLLLQMEKRVAEKPFTLQYVLENERDESLAFYTCGAIFCHMAFREKGGSGVKSLLSLAAEKGLEFALEKVLNLKPADYDTYLHNKIKMLAATFKKSE